MSIENETGKRTSGNMKRKKESTEMNKIYPVGITDSMSLPTYLRVSRNNE